MLQSTGSQRVGHNWETEQNQQQILLLKIKGHTEILKIKHSFFSKGSQSPVRGEPLHRGLQLVAFLEHSLGSVDWFYCARLSGPKFRSVTPRSRCEFPKNPVGERALRREKTTPVGQLMAVLAPVYGLCLGSCPGVIICGSSVSCSFEDMSFWAPDLNILNRFTYVESMVSEASII